MSRRNGRHPDTPDKRRRLKRPSMEQVRLLARLHGCRCRPDVALARLGPDTFNTAIFHDEGCPLWPDNADRSPPRVALVGPLEPVP